MFNIGGGEFLVILLVALVVLGPQRLPEAARQVGKIMGEFRRVSSGFQREMQSAMNDPVSKVTGQPTPKSLSDITTDVTEVAEVPAEPTAPAEPGKPTTAADNTSSGSHDPPEAPMFGDR